MAPVTEAHPVSDFFTKRGLTAYDAKVCFNCVDHHYPGCTLSPLSDQGECSLTLSLHSPDGTEPRIIQFRPIEHALHPTIAEHVTNTFGPLAPKLVASFVFDLSNRVKMQVLELTLVGGVSAAHLLPRTASFPGREAEKLACLLCDLADFFAIAWHAAANRRSTGLVGSSISERLDLLQSLLPTARMRHFARGALRAVETGRMDDLPVVLNHGDLLPGNVLVRERTWRLTGVIDWAEAEDLPFGMTLYGVEHLLGHVEKTSGGRCAFVYHVDANCLRNAFWCRLRDRVPELCHPEMWRAMLLARAVGILLWHGIAWNEGKRDRAVDTTWDGEEVAYLEAFLRISELETERAKVKL